MVGYTLPPFPPPSYAFLRQRTSFISLDIPLQASTVCPFRFCFGRVIHKKVAARFVTFPVLSSAHFLRSLLPFGVFPSQDPTGRLRTLRGPPPVSSRSSGWLDTPCHSFLAPVRAQLPTLRMEIGKFLVSEGILVFPGGKGAMPWEEPARSPGGYTFLRSIALSLHAYCFYHLLGLPILAWKKDLLTRIPFSAPRRSSWSDTPPFPPRSYCFLRWTCPPCFKKLPG